MKITAIIGSCRKNSTYRAVCALERELRALGDVEFEIIFLKDYRMEL